MPDEHLTSVQEIPAPHPVDVVFAPDTQGVCRLAREFTEHNDVVELTSSREDNNPFGRESLVETEDGQQYLVTDSDIYNLNRTRAMGFPAHTWHEPKLRPLTIGQPWDKVGTESPVIRITTVHADISSRAAQINTQYEQRDTDPFGEAWGYINKTIKRKNELKRPWWKGDEPVMFGKDVVKQAESIAIQSLTGEWPNKGEGTLFATPELELEAFLGETRKVMGGLGRTQRKAMDNIYQEAMPPFLSGLYNKWKSGQESHGLKRAVGRVAAAPLPEDSKAYAKMAEWRDASDTSIATWLATGANDEEALSFYQWHHNRLMAMQDDPELQEKIEKARDDYVNHLQVGMELGFINEFSDFARAEKALVLVGDYAHTGARKAAGYAQGGEKVVLGETELKGNLLQFRALVMHELSHIVGQSKVDWVDEVMADHIALSNQSGNWNKVNPFGKGYFEKAYRNYRNLFAVMQNYGAEFMDMKLFTLRHTAVGNHDAAALDKKIQQASLRAYGTEFAPEILQEEITMLSAKKHDENSNMGSRIAGNKVAGKVALRWANPYKRQKMIDAYHERHGLAAPVRIAAQKLAA